MIKLEEKIIIDENGCWLWQLALSKGYGRVYFRGKYVPAHRVSYILSHGEIPEGMLVCHSCDITSCINPEHLWIGTNQDNSNDMKKKGRHHVPRGAKSPHSVLTEEQVIEIRRQARDKKLTQTEIGRSFGISQSHVAHIIKRDIWQ